MPSAARNDAAELRQGRVSAGDIVRQMLLPEPGIVFRQGADIASRRRLCRPGAVATCAFLLGPVLQPHSGWLV